MIRLNESTKQIRVDTTIKIIEKDGTEVTVPVVVLVGINKLNEQQHYNIYKIANILFNKEFILNRQSLTPKKLWWKLW
jgi:mannitol/fructose-specific phosphotransferase system IIA component (Ntr-type)